MLRPSIILRALSRRLTPTHKHTHCRQVRLRIEPLDERAVPAVLGFRSIDGTDNNLANPEWGSAGEAFLRKARTDYEDGVSSPAGEDRPSAREISNAIADQQGEVSVNDRELSAMIYAWGQFIDHDIDLTMPTSGESFPIAVPTGDPSFDPFGAGTQTIPLTRSGFDASTGTGVDNPRQQTNSITAWIDGSMIYGSDEVTANSLRTFQGGRLKMSDGSLLWTDGDGNFLAGDIRVNENPELISLQTLFVREHNRVADQIQRSSPLLTDEEVYQRARAFVIGEIQVITYKEWLPALLGPNAIAAYRGYRANVNPGIANEFATAGFRLGHSLLGSDIDFLGNNGQAIADEVSLAEAFFNPTLVKENGVGPILKYLASDPSSELDNKVADEVRNFLFGPPGAGGLDLASLNIQRGRDHGLADYNTVRQAYGLRRVTNFSQITSNPELQASLRGTYGSVDNIDLWVGALAENHLRGSSVGPTLRAIVADQFARLRDADRFWYQRVFSGAPLRDLNNTTLAGLIRRNTEITTIQPNAFFFRVEITGRVFADRNADGRIGLGDRGIAGRTVELVELTSGEVVATAVSGPDGRYRFRVADGLRTGRYAVREILPQGVRPTTPPREISIVSGETIVTRIDLGSALEVPRA
jgi:hypothetical protein